MQQIDSVIGTAKYLGITVAGLRRMIRENRAPEFFYVGKLIRFTKAAVDKWIEENTVTTTNKPEGK